MRDGRDLEPAVSGLVRHARGQGRRRRLLEKRRPEFWDIRRREAEARAQLLAEYEARHGKT